MAVDESSVIDKVIGAVRFESKGSDEVDMSSEEPLELCGTVMGCSRLSKKLAFVRLVCRNKIAVQIKLDAAWLEGVKDVNLLLKSALLGTSWLRVRGWPAKARSRKLEAPPNVLLAVKVDIVELPQQSQEAVTVVEETEPAPLNFERGVSQFRGKKKSEKMYVTQLLPFCSVGAGESKEALFPSSWWCCALVSIGLGRPEPLPVQDFDPEVSKCIQCTAAQAEALCISSECVSCGEGLTEFVYDIGELKTPSSRFMKRAIRDVGERGHFRYEARGGPEISEDFITGCCICRQKWRSSRPPGAFSKRNTYLSALRRTRSKLGFRIALLVLWRGDEVVAYVLTEAVPGQTAVAVDGCCSDTSIRGADAYLLHQAARWWEPFGVKWINDGPAATEGIRQHKMQHHGVSLIRQVRYRYDPDRPT